MIDGVSTTEAQYLIYEEGWTTYYFIVRPTTDSPQKSATSYSHRSVKSLNHGGTADSQIKTFASSASVAACDCYREAWCRGVSATRWTMEMPVCKEDENP